MSELTIGAADYRPVPPADKHYGIGIIGCGAIVREAHLPAYREYGYRVAACCSRTAASAAQTAEEFGIPSHGTSIEAVLNHPEVEIIDLAVHAEQRLALIEQIVTSPRKPRAILSQKPLAMNYADAERIVELCRAAGIVLMVNQQARWAPAHRALKCVIDSDRLGHIYSVLHFHRNFQDQGGSWFVKLRDFNIVDHGIHYIDLSRFFTGRTPLRVKAATTMVPGQNAVSPLIYSILCEYEPGANVMSTLHFNNIVCVADSVRQYQWVVDGTEGSAMVTHNELTYVFKNRPEMQVVKIEGSWFPDAFGGAMGELMSALTEKRQPQCSGLDNLNSVRIAYAAVASSETGQAIELAEN